LRDTAAVIAVKVALYVAMARFLLWLLMEDISSRCGG
jgi:hypothetical protein